MAATTTSMENILPSDEQSEEGVVACILSSSRSIAKVQDMLTREDFCNFTYGEIFDAALTVFKQGKTCTKQNIVYELKKRDVFSEISEAGRVSATDLNSVEYSIMALDPILDHAERLREVSTDRRLAVFGYELFQAKCRRGERADESYTLEQAQQELLSISLRTNMNSVSTLEQVMLDYGRELDLRRENFRNHVANGVPTGFVDLDHLTGGLQRCDLITLAARPSVGKTAFSLNVALNIVSHARHALFFSLEMNKMSLAQRLVAMETPMDQAMLRDGDLQEEEMGEIAATMGRLSQLDLKIDDQSRRLADIKSKARNIHSKKKLDVIVVDYLQLIRPDMPRGKGGTRAEEVAEISHGLKELAMELNVPVLALAQLNRAVEQRQVKMPQMSDLKESGAIEQDSDVIMFLHVDEQELVKRAGGAAYIIKILVSKHRNGPVGEVPLEFRPRSTKFAEVESTPGADYNDGSR